MLPFSSLFFPSFKLILYLLSLWLSPSCSPCTQVLKLLTAVFQRVLFSGHCFFHCSGFHSRPSTMCLCVCLFASEKKMLFSQGNQCFPPNKSSKDSVCLLSAGLLSSQSLLCMGVLFMQSCSTIQLLTDVRTYESFDFSQFYFFLSLLLLGSPPVVL